VLGDAESNVVGFVRYATDGAVLACLCNFSPIPRESYLVTLPRPGKWNEVINTDAVEYGGSGVGNLGLVTAEAEGTATVQLGPLATVWLRHEPEPDLAKQILASKPGTGKTSRN
jgi:1,4-alpha-glucan branching enzyme